MPRFHYYGRNAQGESTSGYIDKHDKHAVADYLSERYIIPITIRVSEEHKVFINPFSVQIQLFQNKLDVSQLIMFCRQMHTINKAGIPLLQGMQNLSKGMKAGLLKDAVDDIIERLTLGTALSQSMKLHPKVFDSLFISMIEVGEQTGQLDSVFAQLANYIEKDLATKRSIQAATRYPIFVMAAMLLALLVINVWVIPAFSNMFERFNTELPLATQLLLLSSNFIVDYWWLLLALLSVITIGFVYWCNTDIGRLVWGRYQLTIPLAGALIYKASLARYTRSFAVMLKSGIPLVTAIDLCSRVVDNIYLAHKIDGIKTGVERGDSLLNTHHKSGIFTPLVLQMISVGEGSGQVDRLLIDVADFYEREIEQDLKTLSSRIEPLLILFMAVLVLILALGIFLPMWGAYDIQQP